MQGIRLYQIQAIRTLSRFNVHAGTCGGYVQSTENLRGEAWITPDSCVYGRAVVGGYAKIGHGAVVCGQALVGGHALVLGARLSGTAQVWDYAIVRRVSLDRGWICGNSQVGVTPDEMDAAQRVWKGIGTSYAQMLAEGKTGYTVPYGQVLSPLLPDEPYREFERRNGWMLCPDCGQIAPLTEFPNAGGYNFAVHACTCQSCIAARKSR